MKFFCPRCRGLVDDGSSLPAAVLSRAAREAKTDRLAAIDVLVAEGGWNHKDAKRHVLHILKADATCHRCSERLDHETGLQLCGQCRSLNLDSASPRTPFSRAVLRFDGWERGMEKVSCTMALQEGLHIPLKSAKALADLILSDAVPFLAGPLPPSDAEQLCKRLTGHGALVQVIA